MSAPTLYVGIDLGTTNSAAAVFDGETVQLVRNADGANLTPSVVRVDSRGRITVGAAARRHLHRDPKNTHAEFKRLMGTEEQLYFAAADLHKRPEELSAELLAAIRRDVLDQFGISVAQAVISVPALFELPQSAATSRAAELAGFERVELIQEPVASALAAGWDEDSAGHWLVYDIGGGTFDASLLETRDGFLRVVAHDGDNFLGGRDIDQAIMDWVSEQLDEALPSEALRALRRAAEEAKIRLSRAQEAEISVAGQELYLDRSTLESFAAPLVDRTLTVCERLLQAHGITRLERIVLVGGPTAMPLFKARVASRLGASVAEGLDSMALVAQGAAIYAVTAGLGCSSPTPSAPSGPRPHPLWLQYPAMSTDLSPHVVGRVTEGGSGEPPTEIRIGEGDWVSVEADGTFIAQVDLQPRRPNRFTVSGRRDSGEVPVSPTEIHIVQGLTVTDPPLSRSVGVALANNQVKTFFERGAPLPARKTLTLKTVDPVAAGSADTVLKIPVVQGEFEAAHLNRLVGSLEVSGTEVESTLPVGTPIEVTLSLDRGGRLAAAAWIPRTQQVYEQVVHLLVPRADADAMEQSLSAFQDRVVELRTEAFRAGQTEIVTRLSYVEQTLAAVAREVARARSGDADSGQKARRTLLEVDAQLDTLELEKRWPELDTEAQRQLAWAASWVTDRGSTTEKELLDEVSQAVQAARKARDPVEVQRQLRVVRELGNAAFNRHPESLRWRFESAAEQAHRATDPRAAKDLVTQGQTALDSGDEAALRGVLEALWRLLPDPIDLTPEGHRSGVR